MDRQPANAKFIFNDDTFQLEPIAPSSVGRLMDVEASVVAINDALLRGEHTVVLAVSGSAAAVSDTATAAELGITELMLGRDIRISMAQVKSVSKIFKLRQRRAFMAFLSLLVRHFPWARAR